MSTALALAAMPLAAGYFWIGARMWSAMMGAHRVLNLADDPTEPAALFQAAWVRGDRRVRLFHVAFVGLWPMWLAIGAARAAITSRHPA